MAVFPQLGSTKILTQLPYNTVAEFDNSVVDIPSGRRYAYARRTNPLFRYELNLQAITDAEFSTLKTFVDARDGGLESFTFLDPGGNMVGFSEDFTDASWAKVGPTVGGLVTDPFDGTLAYSLTGSGTLTTPVYSVAGGINGFRLCLSVWAKGTAGGQTVTLSFRDTGELASGVISVPNGSWKRCALTFEINTANVPISMRIEISGAMHLFGAQCAPLLGPGAYAKTPGKDGVKTCQIISGLPRVFKGPSENSSPLTIAEVPA